MESKRGWPVSRLFFVFRDSIAFFEIIQGIIIPLVIFVPRDFGHCLPAVRNRVRYLFHERTRSP